MAFPKRIIFAFFISMFALYSSLVSAGETVKEFRIGLIGEDPAQLLRDFDPFAHYLKSTLRRSGIRNVTVFVARDLDQIRSRVQNGELDFILTTAFPTARMDRQGLVPSIVASQAAGREDCALFFVRKESTLQNLNDLRGKSIVFGTPSSTAGYAMGLAEIKELGLSVIEPTTDRSADDAVRYTFAGAAINQAFRVLLNQADAGVISSSDWDALPPNVQSRLRVIHRTEPITHLFGSFRPAFPPALKGVVQKVLLEMSGDRGGRTALAAALNITKFEPLTDEDDASLERLTVQLSAGCEL